MIKKTETKRKILLRIILIILAVILILSAVIFGMCLFIERPALQTAEEYHISYDSTVIDVLDDGGVMILPETGKDLHTGIIFYVGAQIRPSAYIPLLARLAEKGYSCFIPDLTCNTALLEPNAAEKIITGHPEIESWYIGGHSLGGLTASGFADDHRDDIDGLILIAAYSNRDMSDADMPTLAIYGDTDGVMNKALYDKRRAWNPADFEEHIIKGANHAQFGDYGKQPRDNDAKITAENQMTQTADIILDWLSRHNH